MKKILTSIALFGLLATACTNTDKIETPDKAVNGAEEVSDYMSISIMPTGGTRADYEYGTAVENQVSSIRFYFFTADFAPAQVKKNPDKTLLAGKDVYDSYYDYDMVGNESSAGDVPTIEKTISVMLTLNIKDDDENRPKYVVAVLNPSEATILDENPELSVLEGISAAFLPGAVDKDAEVGATDPGKFVMSNSVFAEEKQTINYTEITKLSKTLEDALIPENQTVIYVERVAARLDLTVGKSETSSLVPASTDDRYTGADKENVFFTGNEYKLFNAPQEDPKEPVFVKFVGWKVTSTPKKSNLLKHIDPEWGNDLFGSTGGTVLEPWNAANYHRSFWGINPTLIHAKDKSTTFAADDKTPATTDYLFYSYNDINEAFGQGDKPATVYIQENAAEFGKKDVLANHESKVIVAAQLVNKEGEPLSIVEYGFKYYEKNDLLKYFADQIWLYTDVEKSADATHPTESKLAVDDIMFKTQAAYIDDAGVEVPGGYFSYVALTDEAAKKDWYLNGKKMTGADAVNEYINNHLDSRALVWEGGQTYYYFTIRHLGAGTEEEPGTGYYGVVRNHIYKADITKITGLGTPVLNPDEIIYPEKPERDGHILSAEIKVLAWRVVSQGYEFSW